MDCSRPAEDGSLLVAYPSRRHRRRVTSPAAGLRRLSRRPSWAPPAVVPWMTTVVSLLCAGSYAIAASGVRLVSVTGEGEVSFSDPLHIVGLGARSTPLIADAGEAWRLLSCHFVHTSTLHLVFNLAFLFTVGGAIEQVVRRSDYAALILFTATISALGSLLGTPQISAGASGLVFGVLGAAVTLGIRHQRRLGRQVQRYFGLWVLPFLLIVFAFGVGNPSVDQASHLAGLLAGLFGGCVLSLRRPAQFESFTVEPPYPFMAAVVVAMVAVLAAPLVARGGHPPQRVLLSSGMALEVPGTWVSRTTAHEATQFVTAGGMVVLQAERLPSNADDPVRWFESTRLDQVGRFAVEALDPSGVTPPRGMVSRHVRYRYKRGGHPMTCDVYFLRATQADPWITVLSLETPLTWSRKYAATRQALLASLHPSPSGAHISPPVSIAALQ